MTQIWNKNESMLLFIENIIFLFNEEAKFSLQFLLILNTIPDIHIYSSRREIKEKKR